MDLSPYQRLAATTMIFIFFLYKTSGSSNLLPISLSGTCFLFPD
jgi:hypothetical protein